MNPPSIQLSLPTITKLCWNFPEFDFQRPRSITHPNDQPLYRVKLIPYVLGIEINNLDPKEEFFHIEFFPAEKPARAELWHIAAWRDSLSRLIKNKPSLIYSPDVRRHSPEESADIFQTELLYILLNLGLSKTNSQAAAEMLMRGPEPQKVARLLGMNDDTINRLHNMRKEIESKDET